MRNHLDPARNQRSSGAAEPPGRGQAARADQRLILMGVWRDRTHVRSHKRRNGRGSNLPLTTEEQRRDWRLTPPKKLLRALDQGPANGCRFGVRRGLSAAIAHQNDMASQRPSARGAVKSRALLRATAEGGLDLTASTLMAAPTLVGGHPSPSHMCSSPDRIALCATAAGGDRSIGRP
jgi:hypothetical protein